MTQINNSNILVGSVTRVLNLRMILGEGVDDTLVTYINTLFQAVTYAEQQYAASGTYTYFQKAEALYKRINDLKYECEAICNYKQFGALIDFRASNANITIDTLQYRISQLQILYPPQ